MVEHVTIALVILLTLFPVLAFQSPLLSYIKSRTTATDAATNTATDSATNAAADSASTAKTGRCFYPVAGTRLHMDNNDSHRQLPLELQQLRSWGGMHLGFRRCATDSVHLAVRGADFWNPLVSQTPRPRRHAPPLMTTVVAPARPDDGPLSSSPLSSQQNGGSSDADAQGGAGSAGVSRVEDRCTDTRDEHGRLTPP
eukprot:2245654-Rhodomonas_salina.1